jgi:hypothetical protein
MRMWLWVEDLNVSNCVEDLGVYGRIILKIDLKGI